MKKSTYKWVRENNYSPFKYSEYTTIDVCGTECLIHKFLNWDGASHLYTYGVAPSGVNIVCEIDDYYKIMKKTNYSPISIQSLSPDAPLTSSIAHRIVL